MSAKKELTIVLTRRFKIIFNVILVITVLAMLSYSIIFALDMAFHSQLLIAITNALLNIWKLGFGMLIGMIAGKIM